MVFYKYLFKLNSPQKHQKKKGLLCYNYSFNLFNLYVCTVSFYL